MAAAKRDPMRCEHDRTAATCEACAHASALADPRRAPATRDELYPFSEGGPVRAGFVADNAPTAEGPSPTTSRRPVAAGVPDPRFGAPSPVRRTGPSPTSSA